MLDQIKAYLAQFSVKETISYYLRLCSWIGIVYAILMILEQSRNRDLRSMRSILVYAIFLALLSSVKATYPNMYYHISWFCNPGNTFLRTWLPLFFYAYLVKVPAELHNYSPGNAFSWLFQCILGNFGITVLCGGLLQLFVIGYRKLFNLEEDSKEFDPQVASFNELIAVASIEKRSEENTEIGVVLNVISGHNEDSSISNRRIELTQNEKQRTTSYSVPVSINSSKYERDELQDTFVALGNVRSVGNKGISKSFTLESLSVVKREASLRLNSAAIQQQLRQQQLQQLQLEQKDTQSQAAANVILGKDLVLVQYTSNIGPRPLVPTMDELFYFWLLLSVLVGIFRFSMSSRSSIVLLQISLSVTTFIGANKFRLLFVSKLSPIVQYIVQPVLIYFPVALFFVLATSSFGFYNWVQGLNEYMKENDNISAIKMSNWGAGNYLSALLGSALVILSFSAVDAVIQYFWLFPILVPVIFCSCLLVTLFFALMSAAFATPHGIALSLLTRSVTTPVAVALCDITTASPSIVASSTLINALVSNRCGVFVLDHLRIWNPVPRGVTMAVTGTLLGILAVDENNEAVASGIGMASFGIATICFTIIFVIQTLQTFFSNIC